MSRTIDPESFGFLVTDIARLLRTDMDRRIAASGMDLTPGEVRLLVQAARAGQVRQTVLAARIGIEAMTVSDYVDRLEARGLIERLPDPTDRRAKLVALTDAADAILDQVVMFGKETRESASQGIAPQDWDRVLAALKIVRCNFSDARIEARSAAE
ncbi:MarR family transcriptional regulator [Aliihoeflea aestuarii]|jgi:MarR family transcriptional regulator, transcriptional regulator for hemolysin|uniref:MarR family winged helix-turn-helix transcriptional regulator n=1 Tax=Aliihoeflea aestuarii TaxID=453840 RepID=UPI0020929EC5|nr:MarR family transcriptional regulator [Aliihoeflea aestuarii]MCO6391269.1 MarR family transcriptional regulator [Aliihoeflea aestuarii]